MICLEGSQPTTGYKIVMAHVGQYESLQDALKYLFGILARMLGLRLPVWLQSSLLKVGLIITGLLEAENT